MLWNKCNRPIKLSHWFLEAWVKISHDISTPGPSWEGVGYTNLKMRPRALWQQTLPEPPVLPNHHWRRVTHICSGNLTIISSDNGLSPGWCQVIIWTNAGILLIGPLGTNFSEILIKIPTVSLKKICLKMSSVKCCPFRVDLNVLRV